jgi:hypothetical protein
VPAVAGLAFATRRLVNALSAYLLLGFPSGRSVAGDIASQWAS